MVMVYNIQLSLNWTGFIIVMVYDIGWMLWMKAVRIIIVMVYKDTEDYNIIIVINHYYSNNAKCH